MKKDICQSKNDTFISKNTMKSQTNSPKGSQPNKCDDSGPKLLPMSIINLNKEPKLRYFDI